MPRAPDTPRIDWTQWVFPGPRRVFTPAELARAGGGAWSPAIDGYVYSNVVVLVLVFYQFRPGPLGAAVLAASLLAAAAGLWAARWLWRNPTRARFNGASVAAGVVAGLVPLAMVQAGYRSQMHDTVPLLAGGLALLLSSWWFLTLYRSQQLDGRLRELDEQQQRLAMAQRLAAAQIQPHFLFNTLASLQHWVDTQDARGGPLLRSLTRYLRATLPMFEQDRLPVAHELQIVSSYLDIMQARLGARLRAEIHAGAVPAQVLEQVSLPPGTLLTLAENAITHGIEPSLRGGQVTVTASVSGDGGWLRLEVRDTGPGLSPGACEGVGLTNTRERLSAQSGGAAQMGLEPADPGCLAWIELPLLPADHPAAAAVAAGAAGAAGEPGTRSPAHRSGSNAGTSASPVTGPTETTPATQPPHHLPTP